MDINIDKNIFKKHNVKLAYLFGSRAKGSAKDESDFDIAVLFNNPSSPLALSETTELIKDLSKILSFKIDIVSLNYASLLLKYEVVSSGKLLYCEDDNERVNLETSVIKKYIDEEPLRRLYNEALYKKILQRD